MPCPYGRHVSCRHIAEITKEPARRLKTKIPRVGGLGQHTRTGQVAEQKKGTILPRGSKLPVQVSDEYAADFCCGSLYLIGGSPTPDIHELQALGEVGGGFSEKTVDSRQRTAARTVITWVDRSSARAIARLARQDALHHRVKEVAAAARAVGVGGAIIVAIARRGAAQLPHVAGHLLAVRHQEAHVRLGAVADDVEGEDAERLLNLDLGGRCTRAAAGKMA